MMKLHFLVLLISKPKKIRKEMLNVILVGGCLNSSHLKGKYYQVVCCSHFNLSKMIVVEALN